MKLQGVRRMVQLGVIGLLGLIALLSLYSHYRAAGVVDDPELLAGLPSESAVRAIRPYVERLGEGNRLITGNAGTLWSIRVLGLDVTDPLAAVEMMAASRTVYLPLLGTILIPVIITALLGKVFCSWLCPGYLLFELSGKLRRLLQIAEIEPADVRFSASNKYVFLIVGLVVAGVTAAPMFALIYPPAVVSRVIHAWVFGTALSGMLVILALIVAMEVLVSPRWWCRTMCPGGALYGLLGRWRLLRVRLRDDACTGCGRCLPACEAGINPITESESAECDNCGVCLRYCAPGALTFTIALPVISAHAPRRRGRAIVASAPVWLAVLAVLCPARSAIAHHILGLPHYSYKENYPQTPTLEYPATAGPYDILLTSYPGVPVPGEPANLAFYIKDRRTQRAYDRPVSARILRTRTFGDNEVIAPSESRRPFDNEYKFYVTFDRDGEYVIELTLDVEGRSETIPFLMVVGRPSAAASFALAGGSGLVLAFIVVRAVGRKRKRQKRSARWAGAAGSGSPLQHAARDRRPDAAGGADHGGTH